MRLPGKMTTLRKVLANVGFDELGGMIRNDVEGTTITGSLQPLDADERASFGRGDAQADVVFYTTHPPGVRIGDSLDDPDDVRHQVIDVIDEAGQGRVFVTILTRGRAGNAGV